MAWEKIISPRHKSKLAITTSHWRTWVSLGLAILGLALTIAALSRPQAGAREEEERIQGRNILIAVDTSRSMRVTDVKPSRLDAARTLCFELLEKFPNDRIGIIVFANGPHMLAPLTVDHDALRETIEQLDHNNIPEGGSNVSRAVEMAIKTFKETKERNNGLVIISDGEDHGPKIAEAAADADNADMPIAAVAVGTDDGGLIPDSEQNDGQYRDQKTGKPVLSRMNPEALKTLAERSSGKFIKLNTKQDIASLVSSAFGSIENKEMETRTRRIPNEKFQWFLGAGIASLFASIFVKIRRKRATWSPATAVAISLFLLSLTEQVKADNLTQAIEASKAKDYKKAEELFTQAIEDYKKADVESKEVNPIASLVNKSATGHNRKNLPNIYFGRGEARYKQNKFEDANKDFSKALLSDNKILLENSHFHLGNATYRQGEGVLKSKDAEDDKRDDKAKTKDKRTRAIHLLGNAIQHYDDSIKYDGPNKKNAETNRDKVKKRLEELKKQQEQQEKEDQQKKDQDKKKKDGKGDKKENKDQNDKGDQQKKDGEGDKPGDKKDPSKEGDQQDKKNQDGSDKQNEQDKQGQGDKQKDQQGKGSAGDKEQQKREVQKRQAELMKEGPRDGETAQQYAQRVLKEGSDMQGNVRRKTQFRERNPDKDW